MTLYDYRYSNPWQLEFCCITCTLTTKMLLFRRKIKEDNCKKIQKKSRCYGKKNHCEDEKKVTMQRKEAKSVA